jgi:predicted MFS family arabinose efflux permease
MSANTNIEPTPTTPATSDISAARPLALWRNRDFLLLWSGQAISAVGSSASELALPLLILSITGSPAQAGFAGALRSLAYLVLGLPAGALIDRWDRKRTMLLCDAGRALALGSIPLALALGRLSMVQVYLVSVIEGALYVFFTLAESAALPRVVAREQLPAATAQNEATGGVVTLIGPSLGGALFGVARALPFLADAVSYAASVLSLARIRLSFQEERPAQVPTHLRAEIREGLSWLWHEPVVRSLALLHSGLVLCVSGMSLMLVVIAGHQHATPLAIGVMFGLGGAGAVLGALLGSQVHKRLRLGQILVAAFWLFALLWPLYALAPSPLALGAILAAIWLVDETYDVAQISYRLAIIPDALRGRVTAAIRLVVFGAETFSLTLTGLLLQRLGVLATVACFGCGLLLLAVAATFNRPMRTARALADL